MNTRQQYSEAVYWAKKFRYNKNHAAVTHQMKVNWNAKRAIRSINKSAFYSFDMAQAQIQHVYTKYGMDVMIDFLVSGKSIAFETERTLFQKKSGNGEIGTDPNSGRRPGILDLSVAARTPERGSQSWLESIGRGSVQQSKNTQNW